MRLKLLQVTFEVSLLFAIGTLFSLLIKFHISDLGIQILFTTVYLFISILIFLKLPYINPEKRVTSLLINLMWGGLILIPVYPLIYSTPGRDISITDVTFLTVVGLFVCAYLTIFKNSQSGFISLFTDHLFRRYNLRAMSTNDFILLIYIAVLICVCSLLSVSFINYVIS